MKDGERSKVPVCWILEEKGLKVCWEGRVWPSRTSFSPPDGDERLVWPTFSWLEWNFLSLSLSITWQIRHRIYPSQIHITCHLCLQCEWNSTLFCSKLWSAPSCLNIRCRHVNTNWKASYINNSLKLTMNLSVSVSKLQCITQHPTARLSNRAHGLWSCFQLLSNASEHVLPTNDRFSTLCALEEKDGGCQPTSM